MAGLCSFLPLASAEDYTFHNYKLEPPKPKYEEEVSAEVDIRFDFSGIYEKWDYPKKENGDLVSDSWVKYKASLMERKLFDDDILIASKTGEVELYSYFDYWELWGFIVYDCNRDERVKIRFTPYEFSDKNPKSRDLYIKVEDDFGTGYRVRNDRLFFKIPTKQTSPILLRPNAEMGYPIGDINRDGCVNVADLLLVRGTLGMSGSSIYPPESDVNGDEVVNVADLLRVRDNLGEGCNKE